MKILCLVVAVVVFNTSYALNETCEKTADCNAKEKSSCIDKVCQCDKLSKYSDGLEKCLKYATEYNTLCYEDWQCKDFLGTNSQCLNNACRCKSEYSWYRGKCQKYANKGEACNDDVICFDKISPLALNCTENVCVCNNGYYDRGEDCRIKSEELNPCAINSDCFPKADLFGVLFYSHCELGTCVKNDISNTKKTKEFNNTFRYSEAPSYLKRLMDEESVGTTTGSPKQKCQNGVSSDLPEIECLECPNTFYFKQAACICEPGFFLQDGQCIAELGMKDPNSQYETDIACPIKPGKAVEGVCYCRDYWFQDDTNRECKKTTLQYTKNCLDNDWCKAMGPYAYCNSQTEKCNCSSQAVLNETSFYCEPKPDADFSKICLENSVCQLYETCMDEKCQCDDGFYRTNGTSPCLPKIGYSCAVRDCGHIDNAICFTNETCQCKSKDFVSNGYLCLKMATNLNEECQIQQQCENIEHAECSKSSRFANATSQCLCTEDFLDVDGNCYAIKGPGSQCSTQFNCTIILGDTFECRNNLCQCPIGKKLNKNNLCANSSASRLVFYPTLSVFLVPLILWFRFDKVVN